MRTKRHPDREGRVLTRSPLQDITPAEQPLRLAADRRGMPYLVYRDREGHCQVRTLEGERVIVGRAEDVDVPLPWDHAVSRRHAYFEHSEGGWFIVDDGHSTNGTLVNGMLIRGRRVLTGGDLVQVGETGLAFCDPAAVASGTIVAPIQTGFIEY